jgi:hypothetical protein
MGLFGMSGDTWKKVGGYAMKAAPYALAPFTAGASIPIGMAINGGVGAAQGAMNGGGLKGALLGGGIGAGTAAIPGGAAASGTVKNLVAPTLGSALKTTGIKLGTGIGTNLLSNLANKGVTPPANKPNVYTSSLPQSGAPNMSTPDAPTWDSVGGGGTKAPTSSPYAQRPGTAPTEPKSSYTSTGENAAGNNATDETGLPPGVPPDDGSPGWQEKYGPLIAQGAGLAAGVYAGKKMTQSAAQRSPEELAALANSNKAAGGMTDAGNSMLAESKPYLRKAGGYYSTLLSGNRAAMSQATAAPRAQLQEQLRGQEGKLATSGIRGAARDVIGGQMSRDNAGKVAGLTTGVQPWAADQLANLGTTQAQTATPLLANAGTIYGNLLGRGFENRKYSREEGAKGTEAIGKLASMAGTIPWGKKKPAPGTPGATPTYSPSDYPTYGPPEPPPPSPGGYGDYDPNDYNDPRNTQ